MSCLERDPSHADTRRACARFEPIIAELPRTPVLGHLKPELR